MPLAIHGVLSMKHFVNIVSILRHGHQGGGGWFLKDKLKQIWKEMIAAYF